MNSEREQALRTLVEAWLSHRPVGEWHREAPTEITLRIPLYRPDLAGALQRAPLARGRR